MRGLGGALETERLQLQVARVVEADRSDLRRVSTFALLDDHLECEQRRIQVGDGEERAASMSRIPLRDLTTGIPREDLLTEASETFGDRFVELRERLVSVGL